MEKETEDDSVADLRPDYSYNPFVMLAAAVAQCNAAMEEINVNLDMGDSDKLKTLSVLDEDTMDTMTPLQNFGSMVTTSVEHVLTNGAHSPIAKAMFYASALQTAIGKVSVDAKLPQTIRSALISALRYGYMILEHTEEVKLIKTKLIDNPKEFRAWRRNVESGYKYGIISSQHDKRKKSITLDNAAVGRCVFTGSTDF